MTASNRYRPHIVVLIEDDADRDLFNGFMLEVDWRKSRQIHPEPVSGGWPNVRADFICKQLPQMKQYADQITVMLIDFDNQGDRRLDDMRRDVPESMADRVFVFGTRKDPQELAAALNMSCEAIGSALARDCRDATDTMWSHALLAHNKEELVRLKQVAHTMLFDAS